jgi:hypothetical protein
VEEEDAPSPDEGSRGTEKSVKKKKKKKRKRVQWKWKTRHDISLVEALFKRKISSGDRSAAEDGGVRGHSRSRGGGSSFSSDSSDSTVKIPPYMLDLFGKIFSFADQNGDGSLSTLELMFMLQNRAKGTPLDGDAHAIFTLRTLLAQQAQAAGSRRSSLVVNARSSTRIDLDAAATSDDEQGEIGPREFAIGLMKSMLKEPNGHVAEWILKELQDEAAEWSVHTHEERSFFLHETDGRRQWTKPEILIETERCKREAEA